MPGMVAVAVLVLPGIVANRPMAMPLWAAQIASVAQGGLLLALAVLAGMMFAPEVRLTAPVCAAIAQWKPLGPALRPQLLPGLAGACVGAVILWGFAHYAPSRLADVLQNGAVPASVRLLYGGITEEVLVRWGAMTVLVWGAWRTVQGGEGQPSWLVIGLGIAASAVVFGVVHLPAALEIVREMPPLLAASVVAANSAFGVVTGWLYWRFGLETAMIAHTGAHALVLIAPA